MNLVRALRQHPVYVKYLFQIRQRVWEWAWTKHGKPPYLPAPHTVKQRALREYARRFSLQILVETGTFLGNMVHAVKKDFGQIVSIELDAALHARAQRLFAGEKNVSIVLGDSAELIPTIVETLTEPALFWLDGHYAGPGTAKASTESPILEELRAITSSSLDHVILIDDARLFLLEHEDYPSLLDLQERIRAAWPRYRMRLEDDIIRVHKDSSRAIGQPIQTSVLINGRPGPLGLRRGGAATVTFMLDPGDRVREASRWWIWHSTPEEDWWFTSHGWVASPQPASIGRFLLFDLSPILLWGRKRPFTVPGVYFFGFIVTGDERQSAEIIAVGHSCIFVDEGHRVSHEHTREDRVAQEFRNRLARHFPVGNKPARGGR